MAVHHQHDLYDPALVSRASVTSHYGDVQVVPSELDGMAGLLDHDVEHYRALATFAQGTCGDTGGLAEGTLMGLMAQPVHELAKKFHGKYQLCATHMTATAGAVRTAKQLYVNADTASADRLAGVTGTPLFDTPPAGMTGMQVPAWWRYVFTESASRSYDNSWDPPGAVDDSDPSALTRVVDDAKGVAHGMQDVYDVVFRDYKPLVELLVTPITGDYHLLSQYQSAYDNLGNSTYSIAENERRGLVRIGPRWNSAGSSAFEWEMIRWNQGTGGLGDLAEVTSEFFGWMYTEVGNLVSKVVNKISDMVNPARAVRDFLDQHPGVREYLLTQAPRNCSPIRPPGLTTEETLTMSFLFFNFAAMLYQVLLTIDELEQKYGQIAKRGLQLVHWFEEAHGDFATYVSDSVLGAAQDRVLNLERPKGHKFSRENWNPDLGAWRVAVLP